MVETVLIVGMGKTGTAAAQFFEARGCQVLCFDEKKSQTCCCEEYPLSQKELRAGDTERKRRAVLNVPLKMSTGSTTPQTFCERECLHRVEDVPFQDLSFIVQSPGVAPTHNIYKKAEAAGVFVFSDLDVFVRAVQGAQIIGITGTNGKSTTTALTHHILQSRFENVFIGGNIGVPALQLPIINHAIYVLELSSYQLELSHKLNLSIAALTNIAEDHLDRHKDMENYAKTKEKIFDGASFAVVCCDDVYSRQICDTLEGTHELREIFLKNNPILAEQLRGMTTLPGDHNLQNVAIAVEIARWMGMSENEIIAAVQSFKGLAHRLEYVAEIDGVLFINDSKATSSEPLIMALQSFPDACIFLIVGGLAKRDGIAPAVPYMRNVEEIFLIGAASQRFAEELVGQNFRHAYTVPEATKAAFLAAKAAGNLAKRKIVLLSPAGASFDQFKNFEERGEVFKKSVKELQHA